jgi:hypothetical protein
MKIMLPHSLLPFGRGLIAVLAVSVAVLLGHGGAPAVGTFTAATTVALSSSATSASADTTLTYTLPDGDLASSLVVNFTPATSTVKPGPGHGSFNGATDPALGDVIGTGSVTNDFGLTNGACGGFVTISFPLLNATVDNSGGNLVSAVSIATAGSAGTLESMWTDDGNAPGATPPPGAVAPVNGLPADVDRYPGYLNTVLTPDGGSPVQPLARYTSNQMVAGRIFTLNIVVFSPGALSAFAASNPLADMADTALGYAAIALLHREDPTQSPLPQAITDVCSAENSATTLYGMSRINNCNGVVAPPCNTAGGINSPASGANNKARYSNPASAGTYLWVNFHQSQRDADGDGYENALDTCPLATNTDASPHTSTGPDGDMIDSACDPTPGTDAGAGNQDADVAVNGGSWLNALDNCPLVSNGTQDDSERSTVYTTAARRGGPRTDDIGDACETNDTVANGAFETKVSVVARCIGGSDIDADGWCSAGGGQPADPNDGNAAVTPEAYSIFQPFPIAHSGSGAAPPQRQPVQVCNDGIDNDGDTYIDLLDNGLRGGAADTTNCNPVGVGTTDTDGDGYSDEAEIHIGTDALGRCAIGGIVTDPPSTDWGSDFAHAGVPSSTDKITITDIVKFLAPTRRLGTSPGDAGFDVRYDLVPGLQYPFGSWITMNDLTAMLWGTTGFPSMFGVRAFGGPTCTAHPVYGD